MTIRIFEGEVSNVVGSFSQPVGSGKTTAICIDIAKGVKDGRNYIFVAPTIDLTEQVEQILQDFDVNPARITSDDKSAHDSVKSRALTSIRNNLAANGHVLIVTSTTFRQLMIELAGVEKSRYRVFLDEGMPATNRIQLKFQTQDYGALFQIDKECKPSPTAEFKGIFDELFLRNRYDSDATYNAPELVSLCKMIDDPLQDVFMRKSNKSIMAVSLLSPKLLKAFDEVVIVCAIFDQSLLALSWQNYYGIKFQAYQSSTETFDTHKEKGHLISIGYLLDDKDRASRYALQSEVDGRRIIDYCAEVVQELFEGKEYCWNANKWFMDPNRWLKKENRMRPHCSGLNDYVDFHNVACLYTENPEKWAAEMLSKKLGVTLDGFYSVNKVHPVYQTIGRCSLRNRDSKEPIQIIVLDRYLAETLHKLFEGSDLLGKIGQVPRSGKLVETACLKTDRDKVNFRKYKSRCIKKRKPYLPAEDWMASRAA